jgi:hypothetical protein
VKAAPRRRRLALALFGDDIMTRMRGGAQALSFHVCHWQRLIDTGARRAGILSMGTPLLLGSFTHEAVASSSLRCVLLCVQSCVPVVSEPLCLALRQQVQYVRYSTVQYWY